MAIARRPHMICSVGIGNYQEITYRLGEKTTTTRFAPVALARLLPLTGAATVLVTEKAREKSYAALEGELRETGLEPQPVLVPLGGSSEELWTIFETLADNVNDGDDVVLDITFALRHLPLAYLAALTYLTAQCNVTIKGIYSGAAEAKDDHDIAPILDLTPLFHMTRWYHAMQSAQDSGDVRGLALLTGDEVAMAFKQQRGDDAFGALRNALEKLAPAAAAGLPIEGGIAARQLVEAIERYATSTSGTPALRRSLEPLGKWARTWAVPDGRAAKEKVVLRKEELVRQLDVVGQYLTWDNLPAAMTIMREWMVSFWLWTQGKDSAWLDRSAREGAERHLNALTARASLQRAADFEERLAAVWSSIRDRRNQFAHAGMRPESISVENETPKLRAKLADCRGLLDSYGEGNAPPASDGGVLLVTPLGHSPGIIYTAVQTVRPATLLVISSAEALGRLPEALERADASGIPRTLKTLADPHAGFADASGVVDKEIQAMLLAASEVVVNITGGTTLLQYAAEQVAREAERLDVPVRRVALVDRRPVDEQRANPYVLGEVVRLDKRHASDQRDDRQAHSLDTGEGSDHGDDR